MENLFNVIISIIAIIIAFAILLGVYLLISLIIWGVGNAIIYLFAIPTTWCYWQSCVATFIIWGIKQLIKLFDIY